MMGGNGFKGGRGGFLTEEEKQNSPKITAQLLKRMFSYLIPYWKQLIVSVLAIITSSVFGVFPTILTGRIIDEGLLQQDLTVLIRLIGLSFGVLIIANLISVVESYVNVWMAENITYDMRNKMYSHLQRMSHRFFTTSKQGDIITRMTSDIGGRAECSDGYVDEYPAEFCDVDGCARHDVYEKPFAGDDRYRGGAVVHPADEARREKALGNHLGFAEAQ